MKLRAWLLSILAIGFLGTVSWAQGQSSNSGILSTGDTTSQQNANQPNQNQQQNGNQNQEEAPPQAPRYLTFTKEANPGLKTGKAAGMDSSVEIKSAPTDADVTINGYYMGRTPTTVELPPGEYIVTVNQWGYREAVQVLDVSGGKPYSINPKLAEDW